MSAFSPVDTAVAFTDLYRHWCGDAPGLTKESTRHARNLADSYVADVLSLWDESVSDWLAGAPTILRLESCDIAIFTMRDPHIALYLGSIETDSPVATFGAYMKPLCVSANHLALYWRSVRPCSYAMGRKLADISFECDTQEMLTSLEAHLDDGGSLRITASGIDCTRFVNREALPSDRPAA